mmetsp:Transcript_15105/g.31331  ORF Transcript_15105/g.31331 Transcript_15105/m.31331 type:complete len:110 (-) Transcript_15105:488-817(-)
MVPNMLFEARSSDSTAVLELSQVTPFHSHTGTTVESHESFSDQSLRPPSAKNTVASANLWRLASMVYALEPPFREESTEIHCRAKNCGLEASLKEENVLGDSTESNPIT